MKLVPVDQIPKISGYHKLQELIEEFVNGEAKIVKVDFGEDDYKSPTVWRPLSNGQSIPLRYGVVVMRYS